MITRSKARQIRVEANAVNHVPQQVPIYIQQQMQQRIQPTNRFGLEISAPEVSIQQNSAAMGETQPFRIIRIRLCPISKIPL